MHRGEGREGDLLGAWLAGVGGDGEDGELGGGAGDIEVGDDWDRVGAEDEGVKDEAAAAEVDRLGGPAGDVGVAGEDDEEHGTGEAEVETGGVKRPAPLFAGVGLLLDLDDEGLRGALVGAAEEDDVGAVLGEVEVDELGGADVDRGGVGGIEIQQPGDQVGGLAHELDERLVGELGHVPGHASSARGGGQANSRGGLLEAEGAPSGLAVDVLEVL